MENQNISPNPRTLPHRFWLIIGVCILNACLPVAFLAVRLTSVLHDFETLTGPEAASIWPLVQTSIDSVLTWSFVVGLPVAGLSGWVIWRAGQENHPAPAVSESIVERTLFMAPRPHLRARSEAGAAGRATESRSASDITVGFEIACPEGQDTSEGAGLESAGPKTHSA